tara:strand:+ start:1888 stop:2709 length:822 start_codon:yes stop_codon:yes gene_type:complete
MLDFFKTHILYNNDGYNGFVALLFTAILMALFEVLFFLNVGLKDVKSGLDGLQNKIKTDLDAKLLGSDKYCNYLYNTIRTRHSNKIFDKYCKNKINKKTKQENENDYNELILKIKQSTQLSDIGKTASVLYGTDVKSQVENIENILKSVTSISDPELLISSLYDYYREHPEFAHSNNVIKNLLKDKLNVEVERNAWELLVFVITILLTIIFMFRMTTNKYNFSPSRVLWNFSTVAAGIISFQIYFYFNVASQYEYDGSDITELIDFYKKSVEK